MNTVWLLDVDGVLNASRPGWSAPPRSAMAYANGGGFRLRWEPRLLTWINRLNDSGLVQVRWATTWCEHVAELHRVLPVGPFPAAFGQRPPHLTYDEQKVQAAQDVLDAGDRLVWTDDSVVPAARLLYPQFDAAVAQGRALLIAPQPSRGLRMGDMNTIEGFVTQEESLPTPL